MIAKRLSGAQSAMMREIAAQAGNFRGVCPTIGRLKDLNTAYIAVNGGNRPALMPVSFISRSDTHESVDTRRALTVRRLDNVSQLSYVLRRKTQWQLRKK